MRKINIFFTLNLLILLLFLEKNLIAGEKSISGKNDECQIYIFQSEENLYSSIECTDKNKYPVPILGYDNKNCIVLKKNKIFIGANNNKFFKKGNGLYCAMDALSDHLSWFYVQ